MMNKPSEMSIILMEEHKNILKVIDKINEECDKISKGKEVNEKFFLDAIDFIKNYADKLHHAKEEDLLFKEFCKSSTNLHCNPVDQMLYEHESGRNFIKGLEEGLKEKNKKKVIQNALGYCELLKEHIYKEDNVLYPLSEQSLDKKIKDNLSKKFKDIDKTNKSKIDKYKKFVKEL